MMEGWKGGGMHKTAEINFKRKREKRSGKSKGTVGRKAGKTEETTEKVWGWEERGRKGGMEIE